MGRHLPTARLPSTAVAAGSDRQCFARDDLGGDVFTHSRPRAIDSLLSMAESAAMPASDASRSFAKSAAWAGKNASSVL